MSVSPAIRAAFGATLLWLGFFAGWTLGSVPLTLACAPFQALWIAFGLGLAGAGVAVLVLRKPLASVLLTPAAEPVGPGRPLNMQGKVVLFGGGLIAVAIAGVFFIPTSNALPLWITTISLGVAALLVRGEPVRQRAMPPTEGSSAWIALALLTLTVLVLYIVILRPDADDAFYLNLPIGLLSGQTCMMGADTMYGAEDWPILGSNYRVEALPTLSAALSWATSLPVITVAHLLLPSIWCIVWACVLAVIGHGLFGHRWWIFAALAVLASMVFAGTLQTWGVHGIARLFHGKAPLILIVFPVIVFIAMRAEALRLGFVPTFTALFGLSAVSLGLTANAIYLAPLVVFLSLFSARLAWPGAPWTRLGLVVAAAPPVAAGLWLFLFDRPISANPDTGGTFSTGLAFWSMASNKLTLALLVATLALAAVAARVGQTGRWVTAYLVAFFVVAINPVLWPLYDRFVTGGLTFRMWWSLPLPTFLAAALTWAILRSGRIWSATVVTSLGLIVIVLLPSGLIGMDGTKLRPSIHKIPPDIAPVVRDVLDMAPANGTVLANERISTWLPVWEGHPALVYSRRLYLNQSASIVDAERLSHRQILADWISGGHLSQPGEVRIAMSTLDVRLVVLPPEGAPFGAETTLTDLGATLNDIRGGYVVYQIPPWTN